MIRLALFDIDGTLVRTHRAGVKAFAHVFATQFNAVDGFEKLKFAGRTDVSLVREFFSVHQIPATPENFSRFFEHYVHWLDHILSQTQVDICPGVHSLLQQMRELANPPVIGLLTGNIRLGAELKLRHCGLWDEFEIGAFADDHEERDQIAAIAHQRGSNLLKKKLTGEEVLVIGDTPLDIRCARAIGAKVLAVATGAHPLEELKSHQPEWAVENLTRVTAEQVCA